MISFLPFVALIGVCILLWRQMTGIARLLTEAQYVSMGPEGDWRAAARSANNSSPLVGSNLASNVFRGSRYGRTAERGSKYCIEKESWICAGALVQKTPKTSLVVRLAAHLGTGITLGIIFGLCLVHFNIANIGAIIQNT